MVELELEEHITPSVPFIIGGAVVIPKGLIADLNQSETMSIDSQARKEIELAAMQKVMETEMSLGRIPEDVSAQRGLGYDIISSFQMVENIYFWKLKEKAWMGYCYGYQK